MMHFPIKTEKFRQTKKFKISISNVTTNIKVILHHRGANTALKKKKGEKKGEKKKKESWQVD